VAQLPVVLSFIVGIVGIINVWVRVFINMGWEVKSVSIATFLVCQTHFVCA